MTVPFGLVPAPILSVDDFLAVAYKREIVDRKTLTTTEIADMTRLLATADMKARLASLKGIPDQRCFISKSYRDLLTRALAAR